MIDLTRMASAPRTKARWWATLRMLWPYQRKYGVLFAVSLILILANVGFEIGIGVVQQYFFAAMKPGEFGTLLIIARDCGAIGIGLMVLSAVQHYGRYLASAYAGRALNVALLETAHRFPHAWLQRFHSADLVSRLTNDTGLANSLLSTLAYEVLYQILLGAVALWFLLAINVPAALAAVLVGPALFLAGRFFDRRIRRLSERVQEQESALRARVQEALQEMTAIRAYSMETVTASLYRDSRVAQNRLKLRREWMQSAMWQVILLIQGGVQMFAAVLVAEKLLYAAISPGQVMTFIFLMSNVQQPFLRMSRVWNDMQKSLGAGDRLHLLADVPLEPLGSPAPLDPRVCTDSASDVICIDDVTCAPGWEPGMAAWSDQAVVERNEGQADAPLFRGLSLRVASKETVAIVGASGAGKSSLARLLCGLYRPQAGDVWIGGVSMTRDPERARAHMALVPQQSQLFSGTIRENIVFGCPNATEEEMLQAARQAQVDAFVCDLEHGYDTRIGEQGLGLSGGQRQRIAIARALLRDVPILIMDEPTSALDNETEQAIQQALEGLRHQRTMVIIAHRLSTIRNADRIVVLSRGCIEEEGTHAALLARGGAYARLVALQA